VVAFTPTRDGSALVLNEELRADSGEHGTNAMRYTLSDNGQMLTEDEREVLPDSNEHNVSVLSREPVKRKCDQNQAGASRSWAQRNDQTF
jgi:hypothetical protein